MLHVWRLLLIQSQIESFFLSDLAVLSCSLGKHVGNVDPVVLHISLWCQMETFHF